MHKNNLDDKAIRSKILTSLYHENVQSKGTIIIEELDLCLGEARIDLAVINGIAKGIEIKSDKDSLDRLKHQILVYNKVFDVMEIVIGESHRESVLNMVPDWWGVSVVVLKNSNQLVYNKIRGSKVNKAKDPLSVIQLLWKNEALWLLEQKNLASRYKNKSRDEIWTQLLNFFQNEELFKFVNQCLKMRQNWRFVHQPR
jgi:hypothetical protein